MATKTTLKLNLNYFVNYKFTPYLISGVGKQNKLDTSKQYKRNDISCDFKNTIFNNLFFH